MSLSRGGGPKAYRQAAVLKACELWDAEDMGLITSHDLYSSGYITFPQKTQHISQKSVAFILGVLYRRGQLELIENGEKKKQTTYRYKKC